MSTGTDPQTAGKPNLQAMAPPEISAEPASQPEIPPDSCQLQADAVGAAGADVTKAMNVLRDRLAALRWCRETQAAANGRSVKGFESVAASTVAISDLVATAVSRAQQLAAEMDFLARGER